MAAQAGASNLRCRPDVIWDEVDGRMTVYNLTTHALLELNATAAVVWQQLAMGTGLDPVQILSLRYPDVEPSIIARDISAVLDQFVEAGLAEAVPSAPSAESRK